ncbi:carboxypeptidase-like regulatory domain-containing protein [Thermodesulfovibrionales bacterium]|nr:carboxypeptidase-like regulatory domain-containing protein [Thermodesulfovibrionales bacterium]
MFRKLLVMGVVVLLAGFAQTAIAAGTGSISGTVVRHADGTPLAGVLVQLVPLHLNTFTDAAGNYTFTGAAGNYTFTDLPAGMYDIHIPSQEIGGVHYVGADDWNVQVSEGLNTVVDFRLRKAALIYGYVKTAAGAPIPFAGVSTMIGGGAWSSTDLAGRYELWVAPSPGEFYPITVESALLTGQTYRVYGGNISLSYRQKYNPGAHGYTYLGTATSTHTFFGAYTYYIIVTEADYVALVDTVEGAAGSFYGTNVTGNTSDWGNVGGPPDGLFASVGAGEMGAGWGFGGFGGYILIQPTAETASITVHIVSDGDAGIGGRGSHPVHYENKWDGFHKATAGVSTHVDFSLRQAGAISGRVVDGAGVGIPWASLRGWSEEFGEVVSTWAPTDKAGHFILNHLSPGPNYIMLYTPAGQAYRGPITVVSGETHNVGDLIVYVYEAGTISGTVTDEFGNPISDVEVEIEGKDIDGNPAGSWGFTDEHGRYVIYIAPGRHHLEFSKKAWEPGHKEFVPQHVRGIEVGKGEVVSIDVVLECATRGVTVSGKVINYEDIAPHDAQGVRLPGEGIYDGFGLPQSSMIALDMRYPFTEKDFLDLSPFFVGWGNIKDGYTGHLEICLLEIPGRYTMSLLPSGDIALGMLVSQKHLPGDGGMCVTFHNWQEFSFSPGEVRRNVDFTADTAPTGILKGNIILPTGYDYFPEGWAIIYAFNEAYPIVMPLADAIALPGHTPTYKFRNLPAGTYTLKVYKRGVTSLVYTGVTVTAGQTTTKDIVFAPGVDPAPADDANGCFIATAAFGTPLAEEIDILREFRDEHLLTNELGQKFVAFYNRHSPALAEFIAEREAAKKVVRVALWPLVKIVEFIVGEEREVGAPKKSSDFLGDVVTEWPGALPASAEAQMGLCQSMGRMKE